MGIFLPILSDDEDKTSILKNRIRKNYRHIRKWAKRTETDCFRIYDRDIKEYPLAIDFYAGRFCLHLFADASGSEEEDPRPDLRTAAETALSSLFGASSQDMYWRIRKRRAKIEQYEKKDESQKFFIVTEYGVNFKVNFSDYVDTGLFLDHRETRQMVAHLAPNKRVLNLFAYTCSFSVHAARAGALYTKSVDLSNTYTSWGKENFLLNELSLATNEVVRSDCMQFLEEEVCSSRKYDIIIIDPPTLSRSKKMEEMFDVQVDHVFLITQALRLLTPGGVIFFSTNSRKFRMDESLSAICSLQDISKKTIPFDFHDQKIHQCWKISSLKLCQ